MRNISDAREVEGNYLSDIIQESVGFFKYIIL